MGEPVSQTIYQSLSDKAVIVTGGASGIGAAIVRGFAVQGARVGFLDLDVAAGQKLQAELSENGPAYFRSVDLTDIDALDRAAQELTIELGGCDVLVNNAANDDRHKLSDITPDYWRNRMAVNLDHFIFMSKAVLPAMQQAKGGAIVNMGSCSWRIGHDGMTAYVTAKAAIEGLTNGLARELGPDRIRVNCVIPGSVRTPRQVEKWITPEYEAEILASQCLPDFIAPEDVANLVMFLASDASRMCTSGAYTVDAGWI